MSRKTPFCVALGCDHAGLPLKAVVRQAVESAGHTVVDVGTHTAEPCDYPVFARRVAEAIHAGEAERGVLLCGSGVGVAVAAGKVPGVRACLCHDTYSARQGVEHDGMNVLCLGARVIGEALAVELVHAFLGARFSQEERHRRRLALIEQIERDARQGVFDSPADSG